MGGLVQFWLAYVLGGITFIPLLLGLVLLHAYLTFPVHDETTAREEDADSIIQPGDDIDAIKRVESTLGEKFQVRSSHEAEVAAGYFAVCREYTSGGVGGKAPERVTPVGSTTISAPSPSVYQSMYRSIFDRKPVSSPLDNKGAGKPQKKGGNIFYIVFRHGHLMLFDDDEQLEVRHVISLAHHNVSIYSGGDKTPEGELFIKRNAICLSRKADAGEVLADGRVSKPFYLFTENCSDKEDFYFALLRNQDKLPDTKDNQPVPLQFEVKDIITLVQRLHSSQEHLETRWINAAMGRMFLALYKAPEVENFLRAKITKKISRVKTPAFLSKISLQRIDLGEAAPVITNPRLKELTVDGDFVIEADFRYSGNFRMEVAATARIDLGTRFKAREVNLLLAVVLKRLEGHAMVRIKPPPSNRLWITFQTMPKIDMTIEPIVSSRQITYTLILRQIENRIKEVVAESLVFPNWDDSPFYNTEEKHWRGGIFVDDKLSQSQHRFEHDSLAAQEGDVDQVEAEDEESSLELPPVEKSASLPSVDASPLRAVSRKAAQSAINLGTTSHGSSTSIDTQHSAPEKPKAFKSSPFAGASTPTVGTDVTNADAFKPSSPPEPSHAAAAMAAISAFAQSPHSAHTVLGSPPRLPVDKKTGSQSSSSSRASESVVDDAALDVRRRNSNPKPGSRPPSTASLGKSSMEPEPQPTRSIGALDSRRETSGSLEKPASSEPKRLAAIAAVTNTAVTNAAAVAKKWGWNAIQRHADAKNDTEPAQPRVMGRGQPLPPPGTPLPPPERKTKTAPMRVPARKPVAPPPQSPTFQNDFHNPSDAATHNHTPPPLPKRSTVSDSGSLDDGLMVVAAPMNDSEPTTPMSEHAPSYLPPWVDDDEEELTAQPQAPPTSMHNTPPLPRRRPTHKFVSENPEESGAQLPSWMAAQEEEARAKSAFVAEDHVV